MMTMGLVGLVVNAALFLITAFVGDATGFSLTVGDFPPDSDRLDRSSRPSSDRSS